MKILKNLFGKEETQHPPKWDIKPPAERREPRKSQVLQEEFPQPKKAEPDPFLDDPMLDTMSLEADEIEALDDNPYQTNTWDFDPDNDTRRLRHSQIGEQANKKSGSEFNPYDTGKMRRGWKR